MTLSVRMNLNKSTNLSSWPMKTVHMMINVRWSRSDALTQGHYQRFVTGAAEVINSHSGDSRLMHFNKSQPEVWLGPPLRPPHCSPRLRTRPNNLSPSWRSTKQFEGHVLAETNTSLLFLARHKKADSTVCWTNYRLLAESSCEFSQWWRLLWPPAVLCDPGAQGDKTAITLLYPPAHYQAGCRICVSPRGAAAGLTAACHPDPAAAGRLAGRHAGSR